MIVVGVDENGLGPDLGPMVVTGVAIECDDYAPLLLSTIGPKACRIRDSKEVFSGPNKLARGERPTLPWCRVIGWSGDSYVDLRRFLCGTVDPDRYCAPDTSRLCENSADRELPLWCSNSEVATLAESIRSAMNGRFRFIVAKARFLCARAVQCECRRFGSKVDLDARMLVEVVREIRKSSNEDILVYCGRAGNLHDYSQALSSVDRDFAPPIERQRGKIVSAYDVPGLGHIEFVKGVEHKHSPAALASMIGKYLREVSLDLICEHVVPGMRASGYPGDPKTAIIVAHSRDRRRAMGLQEECFLRREFHAGKGG